LNPTRLPIRIAVSGPANDPILTGQATEKPHYFAVGSGGSGTSNYTTLTLSSGSPIAQALGLNQSASALGGSGSFTGAGIKIGIISDSFNFNPATGKENPINAGPAQADIKNGLLPSASNIIVLSAGKTVSNGGHDEGRAMAEIIHAIAPGATIVFQTPRVEPQYGTDLLSANCAGR
jgi:subtilase family serine protease